MSIDAFLKTIQAYQSSNVFNPYSDVCEDYDSNESPQARLEVLKTILEKATQEGVDAIWLGRDLGHKGGRRTGLALTDDLNVDNHLQRWGITECTLPRPEQPVKENTATVVWEKIQQIDDNIFLWNIFPFHPHEADNPLSNRTHNSEEGQAGQDILSELIKLLKPRKIIAIGNDAFNGAQQLNSDIEVKKVRHPSYGGKQEFIAGIDDEYGI